MTDAEFSLDAAGDRKRLNDLAAPPKVDLVSHIRAAAKQGQFGIAHSREIWQLFRGVGKLTPAEYYYYRLYDPALTREEKNRFLGKMAQYAMHGACNDPGWHALAHDKLLFDAIMRGGELPAPRITALYSTEGRTIAGKCMSDASALEGYLGDPGNYPCFAKPLDGMFSVGALDMVSSANARIELSNGTSLATSDVVRYIVQLGGGGYLFQNRLKPHPALMRAFGPTLACLRLLVLLGPSGPTVMSAVSKIPLARNMADNFWRAGNMVAAIDLGSGSLARAISGTGEDRRQHEHHPETGVRIEGMVLPDWPDALDLCRRAARMFAGIRTQSWDIALTDAGPVAMELNYGGDFNLHQLAHGKGLLNEMFAGHLRRFGYKWK
jgi:hypothetical protein